MRSKELCNELNSIIYTEEELEDQYQRLKTNSSFKDRLGEIIGPRKVIKFAGFNYYPNKISVKWQVKCDCGSIKTLISENLRKPKNCKNCTKKCSKEFYVTAPTKEIAKQLNQVEFTSQQIHKQYLDACKSHKFRDLTGQVFNNLSVIKFAGWHHTKKLRASKWLCRCSCGSVPKIIKGASLISGNTKSCGCLSQEVGKNKRKGKNETHLNEHFLYNTFMLIKNRCENKAAPNYNFYGGRGIKCLIKDCYELEKILGPAFSKNLTVDRINNNGHYERGNIRWATHKTQNRNKINNIYVTIDNETKLLIEWYETYKADYNLVSTRYRRGWEIKEALTRPSIKYKRKT